MQSKAPYVGPVVQAVGFGLDIGKIIESSIPMGAVKTISSLLMKEWTPPKLFFAGKCVWFIVTGDYNGN